MPDWAYFGEEPRVRYLPEFNLVLTIPKSNDMVIARRFDLAGTLKKSGTDYLVVTSAPRLEVVTGQNFTYTLEVLSKAGGVKYTLDAAPDGMTVSQEGKIAWKVGPRPADGRAPVIVSIRDANGQETAHAFTLVIHEKPGTVLERALGAWECAPALDDVKLRSFARRLGVTPVMQEEAIKKSRAELANLRIAATFAPDGTYTSRITGYARDPAEEKGKWELLEENGATLKLLITLGERREETVLTFEDHDRFTWTPRFYQDLPLKPILTFQRGKGQGEK
jgi:hypothetical protein